MDTKITHHFVWEKLTRIVGGFWVWFSCMFRFYTIDLKNRRWSEWMKEYKINELPVSGTHISRILKLGVESSHWK